MPSMQINLWMLHKRKIISRLSWQNQFIIAIMKNQAFYTEAVCVLQYTHIKIKIRAQRTLR